MTDPIFPEREMVIPPSSTAQALSELLRRYPTGDDLRMCVMGLGSLIKKSTLYRTAASLSLQLHWAERMTTARQDEPLPDSQYGPYVMHGFLLGTDAQRLRLTDAQWLWMTRSGVPGLHDYVPNYNGNPNLFVEEMLQIGQETLRDARDAIGTPENHALREDCQRAGALLMTNPEASLQDGLSVGMVLAMSQAVKVIQTAGTSIPPNFGKPEPRI